jgi:hypothetical protein
MKEYVAEEIYYDCSTGTWVERPSLKFYEDSIFALSTFPGYPDPICGLLCVPKPDKRGIYAHFRDFIPVHVRWKVSRFWRPCFTCRAWWFDVPIFVLAAFAQDCRQEKAGVAATSPAGSATVGKILAACAAVNDDENAGARAERAFCQSS